MKDSGRYLDCARGLVEMSKPWDVWWNLLESLEPVTFVKVFFLGAWGFSNEKMVRKASWGRNLPLGGNDSEPWDANRPGICPGFFGVAVLDLFSYGICRTSISSRLVESCDKHIHMCY